ncbi:MAG TPA: hypothetical protein V6C88_06070, partial [Chroococcidiopsis sp.]
LIDSNFCPYDERIRQAPTGGIDLLIALPIKSISQSNSKSISQFASPFASPFASQSARQQIRQPKSHPKSQVPVSHRNATENRHF